MSKKNKSLLSLAKYAFTVGAAFRSSFVLFTFVAFILFVIGFILVKKEHAKSSDEQSDIVKGIGYMLMGLGIIISAGNFGIVPFINELSEEF